MIDTKQDKLTENLKDIMSFVYDETAKEIKDELQFDRYLL